MLHQILAFPGKVAPGLDEGQMTRCRKPVGTNVSTSHSVFVFCGCHNKAAQMGGFNNRNLCSHVLEAGSLRSGSRQAGFILRLLSQACMWPSLKITSICIPSTRCGLLSPSRWKFKQGREGRAHPGQGASWQLCEWAGDGVAAP